MRGQGRTNEEIQETLGYTFFKIKHKLDNILPHENANDLACDIMQIVRQDITNIFNEDLKENKIQDQIKESVALEPKTEVSDE